MASSAKAEFVRKGIHLLSAAVPLAYAAEIASRTVLSYVLGGACAIAIVAELTRVRHPRAREVFQSAAGSLLREHEQERWSGATWLAISLFGAVLLLPRQVAIAAMWAVSVGDAAAAIIGRIFGRRVPSGRKSWQGSAACIFATMFGALVIARLPLANGVVAGFSAGLAEWPRSRLDDNIRIVAAVGASLLAINAMQ